MPFIDIDAIPRHEVCPGCRLRTPYGENLMLSYLEMDANAVVPLHNHPHEQGGMLLEGKLELLKTFYDRGLRELQLCWSVSNQIVEEKDLTAFGRQVVRECDRLGIIVSLTHIPEPAFFQVIEMAQKPPIVCHGTASIPGWEISDLSDRKLKALASRGGVLGIHFYRTFHPKLPSQPGYQGQNQIYSCPRRYIHARDSPLF